MRKYKNAGEEMYNLLFVAVIKIMAKSNSEKKGVLTYGSRGIRVHHSQEVYQQTLL